MQADTLAPKYSVVVPFHDEQESVVELHRKLMGDASVVAQQKDALVKFVQSAKYPDAH